jgi:hypothetical protein
MLFLTSIDHVKITRTDALLFSLLNIANVPQNRLKPSIPPSPEAIRTLKRTSQLTTVKALNWERRLEPKFILSATVCGRRIRKIQVG